MEIGIRASDNPGEEPGHEMAAEPKGFNAREIKSKQKPVFAAHLCPCGSGQYPYKLFNTKKEFVLLCCYACEKRRRNDGGDAGVNVNCV